MEHDFTKRRHFPGTSGTPFDSFLHAITAIERIPIVVFPLLLLVLSLVPYPLNWQLILIHWLFYLGDWILVASLPRFSRSFGKPKPPVLILALLRTIINLLPPFISIPLQFVGTLLVIYSFWIEPHRIGLTHQTLISPKIEPGQKIKVLHLGDLHVERITDRERQLNRYVKEIEPDIILFSGDFINLSYLKDAQAQRDARRIMQEWTAPYGAFAVSGSPAVDLPEILPDLLADLPLQLLNDKIRTINIHGQEIELIGLSCSHKPFVDGQHLETLAGKHSPKLRILLYHSPDLAPQTARLGIELQLSGHTHGGQVRLPFFGALFSGSLYGKRYEMGRYQLENTTLYVSRGIGLEGAGAPRVRFLCPPEIILWEIVGENKPA